MVSAVLYVVYLLLRHKNRQIKGEEHMTDVSGWSHTNES